jgi:hypothetical protein
MLLFRLILIAVILTSCDFKPIYKTQVISDSLSVKFAKINIVSSDDDFMHDFRNSLTKILNPMSLSYVPEYDLNITLKKETTPVAIRKNSTASRKNIKLSLEYILKDKQSSTVLAQGVIVVSDAYDTMQSEYAVYTADNYITENVMHEVSKDLANRLSLSLIK